jgi:DNA-binding response OmpR family regulator
MENLKILIIEDDIDLRVQLAEYLKLFFKTVYESETAEDGYKIYIEHDIDVLMSDINLPKMNGLDLVKKIRKDDNDIPIIILSAHTDTKYFLQAIELNLITYLIKPIQTDKFRGAILKSISNLTKENLINLKYDYIWNKTDKSISQNDVKLELTSYEKLLIECLLLNPNRCITYDNMHDYIYDIQNFSKDALSSLVKRIRQKTQKEFIISCYKEGYKIEL